MGYQSTKKNEIFIKINIIDVMNVEGGIHAYDDKIPKI